MAPHYFATTIFENRLDNIGFGDIICLKEHTHLNSNFSVGAVAMGVGIVADHGHKEELIVEIWRFQKKYHGGRFDMLYWTAVFFIIAILAAVFGFTGIAIAAAGIARILFFIFLVFFFVTLIAHLMRRGPKV